MPMVGSPESIAAHPATEQGAPDPGTTEQDVRKVGVDVSVVLPVHNEVGHIEKELRRIKKGLDASSYSYEIIVVDDGSTDGSKEVLQKYPGIRLIDRAVNRGCGHARRTGSRAALGRFIVWTDTDMTYPNDQIPALLDELRDPTVSQVVGARKSEAGSYRWARMPMKWCIRKLASYLVRSPIPDLNSGYRAFRRDVASAYLHLLPDGFSCVTTITLAFLSNGHRIKYLPIDYEKREGISKFRFFGDTARYILQVVRMVMTFNPLRVFLPLGGLLLMLAIGKIAFDIYDKNFYISTNAVILTVVAFQVMAIGLLADLICRLAGPRR